MSPGLQLRYAYLDQKRSQYTKRVQEGVLKIEICSKELHATIERSPWLISNTRVDDGTLLLQTCVTYVSKIVDYIMLLKSQR